MRYQTIQEFNSNTALTPIKELSRNPKLLIPSPILLLMLAACGGGGGGGARPVVTAPASLHPDLLSGLPSATTDENNEDFSHPLLPTDELEGEVTLSLAASSDDNDNEFFVIDDSGNLVLSDEANASVVFDHETTPNHERTVTVTATATNGSGDSLTEDVVISINDIADEAPIFTSSSHLQVYEGSTGLIAEITATPDTEGTSITYSIDDNAFFAINSETGILRVKDDAVLNYDLAKTHIITVTATDDSNTDDSNNALTAEQTITIRVKDTSGTPTDVDEDDPVFPATPTAFTLAENATGVTIGTVTANDASALTYRLDTASTALGFAIDASTGEITFDVANDANLTAYDHDMLEDDEKTITLMVTAEDARGNNATHQVNVTIRDLADEDPVFDGNATVTTSENNANFSHALPFLADLGGAVTLTLAAGVDDNNLFEIDNSGNLVVKALAGESADDAAARVLDYDTASNNERTVTVTATDASYPSLVTSQDITISITDVNEAPVFPATPTAFNLPENATGVTIGTVTATDPEGGSVTYSLNNAPTGFVINDSTGAISFNGTAYNYEALGVDDRTITLAEAAMIR